MKALLTTALAILASLPHPAIAFCDRPTLQNITDAYITAQSAGSLTPLNPFLTTTTPYTENYQSATLTTGILSQPLTIAHNRSTHDTTQCATYTELIVTDPQHPYVIGTQIRLSSGTGASSTNSIANISTIVTDAGDWLFNATGTFYWASREDWGPIETSGQESRATIQAAADAYLDYFSDKSVVVPWGTPCDRLEGGSYTGNGSATDSCDVGVPSGVSLTDRRYVIDETVGTVDVFLSFEGLPDSHEFRVEGGKLRFVHTLTVMQ